MALMTVHTPPAAFGHPVVLLRPDHPSRSPVRPNRILAFRVYVDRVSGVVERNMTASALQVRASRAPLAHGMSSLAAHALCRFFFL